MDKFRFKTFWAKKEYFFSAFLQYLYTQNFLAILVSLSVKATPKHWNHISICLWSLSPQSTNTWNEVSHSPDCSNKLWNIYPAQEQV